MHWECERHCGAGGVKHYPSAERAHRYAEAFDQEYGADHSNAPLFGLLPLRLLELGRRIVRRQGPDR